MTETELHMYGSYRTCSSVGERTLTSPPSVSPRPTVCKFCLQRQSKAASHRGPRSTMASMCVYMYVCVCVCVCRGGKMGDY